MNVRLNHFFKLNGLRYGPYPEEDPTNAGDVGDPKRKNVATWVDEGCSKGKVVATAVRKKRKVDAKAKDVMNVSGVAGASNRFVEDLAETCAEPWEVMTSPNLQVASSRLLKVTGGEWHKKILFPWLLVRIILRLLWLRLLNFFHTSKLLALL